MPKPKDGTRRAIRDFYEAALAQHNHFTRIRSIAANAGADPSKLPNTFKAIAMFVGIPFDRIGPDLTFEEIENGVRAWAAKNPATKAKDAGRYPANYYAEATPGVTADTLNKARRDGRLQGAEKVGGRWHYPEREVSRLYPTWKQHDET